MAKIITHRKKALAATLWQVENSDFAFDPESIEALAPAASGVYGLYNYHYQLYIGEAADIRAALRRYYADVDEQPERFRPTGFTFELAPAETRALKSKALIGTYQPVLQLEWPTYDAWNSNPETATSDPQTSHATVANSVGDPNHTASVDPARPVTIRKRLYLASRQLAVLLVMLTLSLTAIFFLGVFTGESLQKKTSIKGENPPPNRPPDDPANAIGARLKPVAEADRTNAKSDRPEENVKYALETTPRKGAVKPGAVKPETVKTDSAKPDRVAPPKPIDAARGDSSASPTTSALAGANVKEPSAPTVASVGEQAASWTVQIAASPDRQTMEQSVANLRAKGFDGYVAEVDRDGQTWYRVRVGKLSTRGEAEALRQSLASQAPYRDAFIASYR